MDEFSKTYNGFSGLNMVAMPKNSNAKYAWIQAVRFQETIEKAPMYTGGPYKYIKWDKRKRFYTGVLIFNKFFLQEPINEFDIHLLAVDEFGHHASKIIHEVEILEEGKPWDPHNMYEVDKQYTYIAKGYTPWKWSDGTPCNSY